MLQEQVIIGPLYIQNKQQKIDSTVGFKLLWYTWRIIGMNPPAAQRYHLLYQCYTTFIAVFSLVCFPATMLINLYFIDNVERLLGNLSLSLTTTMSALKFLVLFFYRKILKENINDYLQPLDQRCAHNDEDRQHIAQAIRICRIFYWTYLFFIYFTAIGYSIIGFIKHHLPYDGWFPSLLANEEDNFWLAYIYQNVAQIFILLQNTINDIYPQCYLAVMIGHLRALKARIRCIGNNVLSTKEENFEELLRCIQDHKNVVGYFDCIRPIISRTILLQFLITAFVLCTSAISFIVIESDAVQHIVKSSYLLLVVIEVFPCCWYMNLMLEESNELTNAMYACKWYKQNTKFRRTLIIFMQRSQKTNVVLAGNLAPITLQTFLATIRFSFSMYTLMSKMKI